MPEPQETPWSDNPNAPRISYAQYLYEKSYFSGSLVYPVLYGIVIMLFFQCIAALLNPVHRKGQRIKWWLVSYTALMFSASTVLAAVNLNIQSRSLIDNREFPGVVGMVLQGPLGYLSSIDSQPPNLIPEFMFFLNGWLADGLLLYRCYIIYTSKLWVIAFPCFMYLGSISMGIMFIYETAQLNDGASALPSFGLSYLLISTTLNVLLTLMIIIRLVLHTRKIRTALGITDIGGLCMTVITMLIESSALYAVSSLLVIIPWALVNRAESTFIAILSQTQVIAPLLIIQRVANKSAFTSNTLVSGNVSEFKVRSVGGVAGSSGSLPCEGPMDSVGRDTENSGELGVGWSEVGQGMEPTVRTCEPS